MAKRRKKGRRGNKKVSIGTTVGFGVYGLNSAKVFWDGTPDDKKMDYLITHLIGVRYGDATTSGKQLEWDSKVFMETWGPVMLGIGISMAGAKLGLNKYLRNVPFIGKNIKF